VAYRDGRLQRLRHVGQNAVREVWGRCWDRLGLTGPDERIEAARKYIQEANQDRRSVSLWGAVEAVLTRSVSAEPAQNDVWLAELSELFRTDARGRRPVRLALERLLQEIESFAAGKSPRRPLPQGDFLSALIPIPRFYRDWLPVPDRERVDQTVRTSNWSYKVTGDPAVKELKERAECTLGRLGDKPASVLSLQEHIDQVSFELERWANAYLISDWIQFRQEKEIPRRRALVGLMSLESSGERRLLAVTHKRLTLCAVDADGAVTPRSPDMPWAEISRQGGFATATPGSRQATNAALADRVQAVARIRDREADRVLLVDDSGRFHVLAPDDPDTLQYITSSPDTYAGQSWILASCDHREGGNLLVAVSSRGRRASLLVGWLEEDRLRFEQPQALDVPRVSALDLRPDPAVGYRLLLAPPRPSLSTSFGWMKRERSKNNARYGSWRAVLRQSVSVRMGRWPSWANGMASCGAWIWMEAERFVEPAVLAARYGGLPAPETKESTISWWARRAAPLLCCAPRTAGAFGGTSCPKPYVS